jgi:hypothetical protein
VIEALASLNLAYPKVDKKKLEELKAARLALVENGGDKSRKGKTAAAA